MFPAPEKYAIVDCETTGLPTIQKSGAINWDRSQDTNNPVYITEIALVIVDAGSVVARKEWLIKVDMKIGEKTIVLNGLSSARNQRDGVDITVAIDELENLLIENEVNTIIGQNIFAFDIQLLWRAGLSKTLQIHDTKLIWIAALFGLQPSPGLCHRFDYFYGRVAGYIDRLDAQRTYPKSSQEWLNDKLVANDAKQTHRALDDCLMCKDVFDRMVSRGVWADVFGKA